MATYNLGKFALRPRGTYDPTATYYLLDLVYYNGSSYVCTSNAATTNVLPTNTSFWQIVAAAGQGTITPEQMQQIVDDIVNTEGVVIDPDYQQFTAEEKSKLSTLTNPNDGVLTIKKNNVTLGTFSANQASNRTINVSVPSRLWDLSGADGLRIYQEVETNPDSVEWTIDDLKPSMIYRGEIDITSLTIGSLGYDPSDPKNEPTEIYFRAGETFDVSLPDGCKVNNTQCVAGRYYSLIGKGDWFTLTEYNEISKA